MPQTKHDTSLQEVRGQSRNSEHGRQKVSSNKELPSEQTRAHSQQPGGPSWGRADTARPAPPHLGRRDAAHTVTPRAPPPSSRRQSAPRAALAPGPRSARARRSSRGSGMDARPGAPPAAAAPALPPLPPPGPGRCQRRSTRASATPGVRSSPSEPHRIPVIPRCLDAGRRRGPPAGREARPAQPQPRAGSTEPSTGPAAVSLSLGRSAYRGRGPADSPPVPARIRCPVRPLPPGQRRHPPLPHGAVAKGGGDRYSNVPHFTARQRAAIPAEAKASCPGSRHVLWYGAVRQAGSCSAEEARRPLGGAIGPRAGEAAESGSDCDRDRDRDQTVTGIVVRL